MALIDGLRSAGLLAFDCNYSVGSLTDSVSGNVGTVTAPVNWSRSGKQKGLYFNTTGKISYPDTVANNLAGGQSTIIVFGGPFTWHDSGRLITKRTTTTSWEFAYRNATPGILVYDGTNTSYLNASIINSKFLAYTNIAGSAPIFYKDGCFFGQGNLSVTPKVTSELVYVGAGFNGLPIKSTISRVIGISRVLTPSEISTIYEELLTPSATIKQYSFPGKLAQVPDTFYGDQLLVDGDMEAAGVANWTAQGAFTPTKEISTLDNGKCIQILQPGTVAYPRVRNSATLVVGKKYRVTGWCRATSAMVEKPYVVQNSVLLYGTTSTSWQYFDLTFFSQRTYIDFGMTSDSGYGVGVQFDNIQLTEVYGKSNLKLHYLLDKPIPGTQTIADLSGNGYNGIATGIGISPGLIAKESIKFQGNVSSNITLTNGMTNTIANNDQHTISCWFKSSDYSNLPIVFMSSSGDYYVIILGTGATIRWRTGSSNKDHDNVNLKPNVWYHLVVMKTGATTGVLYLNGQLVSGTGNLAATGATPGNLIVGAFTSSTLHLNGNVQDFRIYDQNLTNQEISALYFQGAQKLNIYIPMKEETEESLSAVTSVSSKISNTPWCVHSASGSFTIGNVRNKKMLKASVTAKTAGFESNQAFGTWVFEHICAPTEVADGPFIDFICNQRQGYNITGNNSYALQITAAGAYYFYKVSNGVAGSILASQVLINANKLISVAITRDYKGVFNLYIKNTTWTLSSATFTDLGFTTSSYFNVTPLNGTNIQISNVRLHEGVLTLDQIKSLYPNG